MKNSTTKSNQNHTYSVPVIDGLTDEHGKPLAVGHLAYSDGCGRGGIIVGVVLDQATIEYVDDEGNVGRFSDYAQNMVSGGYPSTSGVLAGGDESKNNPKDVKMEIELPA